MSPDPAILQLYFRGHTVAQIGCDLHIGRSAVYNTLWRRGLKANAYYYERVKHRPDHFAGDDHYLIDRDAGLLPDDLSE